MNTPNSNRLEVIAEAQYKVYDLLMAEAVKEQYDLGTRAKLYKIAHDMLEQRDELRRIGGENR